MARFAINRSLNSLREIGEWDAGLRSAFVGNRVLAVYKSAIRFEINFLLKSVRLLKADFVNRPAVLIQGLNFLNRPVTRLGIDRSLYSPWNLINGELLSGGCRYIQFT